MIVLVRVVELNDPAAGVAHHPYFVIRMLLCEAELEVDALPLRGNNGSGGCIEEGGGV